MGSPTTTDMSELGCNIYVATLPLDFDDRQLFDLFAPYGSINSARIMRKKGTRDSKGYGFVFYKNASSAELAIGSLSGSVIGGKRIQVRLAHPDASAAYNSQHTPKSSSSTPGCRPLHSMHQPPPSPLQLQSQHPPLVSPPLQPLVPAPSTNPPMIMATAQFPTLYPTMYPVAIQPAISPPSTPAGHGVFPPPLMLVQQFTPQPQQVTPQTTFYVCLPESGIPSPAIM
ncbi:RNA-binding protein 5 [Trypanosoma rangeli]|uniref:RNA-binding protein 5 n=1 Tax=Trypanosoma rangeli TaxID=5698 RepID=A0A422NEE5_TRYRA|nr:RNA-binding protein 5 [Trypanosoma rangeli]RNF03749.1 RNA-binding protein 5 [Trypanosoma rangeli]|eukprot:RNF03749.1 RNA-binding protein 5 [Trypanosoma rangeli]